ncbi:MAG: hypothetical protein IVW52_12875 [Acidimicrobiales bacterium]|nr:hypothetical protein [Acidimicrobiales bacterium]
MNASFFSGTASDLAAGDLPNGGGRYFNFDLTEFSARGDATVVRINAYGAVASSGEKIVRDGTLCHVGGHLRQTRGGRLTLVARQIAFETAEADQ